MTQTASPEIGKSIDTLGYKTNYHDVGTGEAVLMLHGSGAGVSGWANWRLALPALSPKFRCIVPDLVGFGYTEMKPGFKYVLMDTWVDQVIALLDALKIERAHFIGNSFGGSLTMHVAVRHPDRVGRIVLMGSGGVKQAITPELDELWGYKPSVPAMKRILQIMAYNQDIVTDELAELRYRSTLRPEAQAVFESLFPEPRQRWLDAQKVPEDQLRALKHETLIIHGRDDRVVPVIGSIKLSELIDRSQLHIFGRCGHWTMIEHTARFNRMVDEFLSEKS